MRSSCLSAREIMRFLSLLFQLFLGQDGTRGCSSSMFCLNELLVPCSDDYSSSGGLPIPYMVEEGSELISRETFGSKEYDLNSHRCQQFGLGSCLCELQCTSLVGGNPSLQFKCTGIDCHLGSAEGIQSSYSPKTCQDSVKQQDSNSVCSERRGHKESRAVANFCLDFTVGKEESLESDSHLSSRL